MRFATTAAGEQAWNAAALAADPAEPAFRVWTWPRPAIVLGRAQRKLLDEVRERAGTGIEVLARDSGGGAVLAGPWMVGASVVLPVGHRLLGANLIDAYRWLGEAYYAVVQEIGIAARLVRPDELQRGELRIRESQRGQRSADGSRDDLAPREPVAWACYGSLSPWELVDADGRKLVGLAQQRRRNAVLLVSGLLAGAPEWPMLCRALGREADLGQLSAWTTSLEALRGERFDDRFAMEVAEGLDAAIASAIC
ncbi:MAG: lipoate--protein ligase family protein [Limnobacter sp.]|mgnify:CR=1 FL=1|nr:lipoate--protein ligase family protein [Limnobacter sp.]